MAQEQPDRRDAEGKAHDKGLCSSIPSPDNATLSTSPTGDESSPTGTL